MTQALDADTLSAFQALVTGEGSPDPLPIQPHRLYKPLSEAADVYRHWAEHPEERVYTGINELDSRMRGTAPGELTQILGMSHGGKTVVGSQILLNNADKGMVLFTPDETRTAVLSKMVALVHNIDAEELEQRIFRQDQEARRLLLSTATEYLPHLGVCEDNLDLREMSAYLAEYEQVHGPCAAVMFDFLRLLKGEGEDTASKFGALKSWGKKINKPLFILHQTSRTAGADGKKITMHSGEYGGESESTHIIGVRRKRAEIAADITETLDKLDTSQRNTEFLERRLAELQYELGLHESTITINLVKNKRPPMKLVDDLDFYLDQRTGKISPLKQGEVLRSARAALQERELF